MYSTSYKHMLIEKIRRMKGGFTLIEILMVVLIIGILGAIALPQYQRAVLKSRYAALMPIAKSMADSNEAYYLEYGEYADNAQDLPVQGRMNYQDGTTLEFGTTSEYSYVLATRDNDFPNKYIVYQKHSDQFPGEIHCEADSTNDMAKEVCKSFGATEDIGEILTPNYLTYVLVGTGNGVARCPQGATCNSEGVITACPNGKTLHNGACTACDIANATACSTTSYEPTSCVSGYYVKDGACAAYDYGGDSTCSGSGTDCSDMTFGDSASCANGANCTGATFGGESSCTDWATYCRGDVAAGITTTFTDQAVCTNKADCRGAVFTGESSCTGQADCESGNPDLGTTMFTDNASCSGQADCDGSIFSGNSICTSGNSCSHIVTYSTFKDYAVCAGVGCQYANYEGNACCAGNSYYCGSGHIRKCVYNSDTQTYDRVGYWDDN